MPRIDEFYYKQPPLAFVDELKRPYYSEKAPTFNRGTIEENEVDAHGIYLSAEFPDSEGLLETIYFEFDRFSRLFEISGDRYPVVIKRGEVHGFESFSIDASSDKCELVAEDTEGVRRALVYIMDELVKREGAFLPIGKILKYPVIKTRITRGFFSPTNRPPKNRDELMDDIDYYPDEYLNRLMHDGINGIWIYTRFSNLITSEYIPEYGEDKDRRIEKLRRVVKKCRRYGIKVYIFAIEPFNLGSELAKVHPELLGAKPLMREYYPVCPSSEAGAKYIVSATEKIFRELPELAGFIDITYGERMTSCVTSPLFHTCPRCSKKTRGKALSEVVNLLREGMRRAGTGAEMISWTYGHRSWAHEDIREYVRECNNDVSIMQNFEDMGYPEQLGKTRIAVDYWLSYVGPSPMFLATAEEAQKTGKELYAKMQVCCSHELATVPYIPAPGIIYDKYAEAIACGVTGVVECWYFGNYPSLMSKAAGELSFKGGKEQTKEEFLLDLSARLYGKSRAESVAHAFELFEKSYKNYPVNVMFSYYGPVHDGVVWKLRLKPSDICLPRSWQLLDVPDGDRINDCLWYGHTLDEAKELTYIMQKYWAEGMKYLGSVSETELYTLSSAIGILFESGNNILNFYSLRDNLCGGGKSCDKILSELSEMENIIKAEMENSRKMTELCNKDSRLGYHSEAEGYKFFPEKLTDRIAYLENLLSGEFCEIRGRVESGLVPFEFYSATENGEKPQNAYYIREGKPESFSPEKIGETSSTVAISYDDESIYALFEGNAGADYLVFFEYKLGYPAPSFLLSEVGIKFTSEPLSHQSIFGEKIEKYLSMYKVDVEKGEEKTKILLTISRKDADWTENTPFRLRLGAKEKNEIDYGEWVFAEDQVMHLGKMYSDPKAFRWIIPE